MTITRKEDWTLITGASQGIGKAMALECAKREMNLFLIALPDSGLKELSEWLRENFPVRIEYLETDLTIDNTYKDIYEFSKEKELTISILINNAGIGYNGNLESMSAEDIDKMIMLNVRATTMLTYIYLKDLMSLPKAYILNMGSMAAYSPLPGKSIYAATKAFVLFFSKALGNELKNTGVSVTSVYPFGVLTNHIVKERIKKSGMLAKWTAMPAEEVAIISINGMLKGKSILIPGNMGKVLFYTGLVIPQGLVLKILEREIKKAPR
jgi:uncharacterized protein